MWASINSGRVREGILLPVLVRGLIAEVFRSTVDEIVSEHYPTLTQEHHLTARLGQAIEGRLNSMEVFGYRFSVIAQDVPDRGRGSLESLTGIDLYVGLNLLGEGGFSKGFLVQAKWVDSNSSGLAEQSDKMLRLSKASYVWVYGRSGVKVIWARSALNNPKTALRNPWGRNLGAMMRRVLACKEGDPALGTPPLPMPQRRRAVASILMERSIRNAIDVEIIPPG